MSTLPFKEEKADIAVISVHSNDDEEQLQAASPSLPAVDNHHSSPLLLWRFWASLNSRICAAYVAYFMCGWGDGVTGTVLPFIMRDLHLNFMVSSLLFLASTIGFFFGTWWLEGILNRLGLYYLKGKPEETCYSWAPVINFTEAKDERGHSEHKSRHLALLISSILHGMFFVMMGVGRHFGVVFIGYVLAAFARSILTGSLNKFFVDAGKGKASYAFAWWTLGGMASTLLCQTFLARNVHWTKFFQGSLIFSAVNVLFLHFKFRPTNEELENDLENARELNEVREIDEARELEKDHVFENVQDLEGGQNACTKKGEKWTPPTRCHLSIIILFTFLYYGCETPTQGFIVSYLLDTRNANPKTVGYVASGFWGAITVGQTVWGVVAPKLTRTHRHIVVLICMLIGLAMQIVIWTVPSGMANSIAVCIIGLVYGPVFPATFELVKDRFPEDVQRISLAWISAASNVGSALFSFVVGIISNTRGIHILPYLTLSLAITSTCIWALIPAVIPATQHN